MGVLLGINELLSTAYYEIILKGPYVSNLKAFTSKPTNQGCALHVPASLGIIDFDILPLTNWRNPISFWSFINWSMCVGV